MFFGLLRVYCYIGIFAPRFCRLFVRLFVCFLALLYMLNFQAVRNPLEKSLLNLQKFLSKNLEIQKYFVPLHRS